MTGHAFQKLVEDHERRTAFAAIRSALAGGGLVSDTRNPLARLEVLGDLTWDHDRRSTVRETLPRGLTDHAVYVRQQVSRRDRRPRDRGKATQVKIVRWVPRRVRVGCGSATTWVGLRGDGWREFLPAGDLMAVPGEGFEICAVDR